MRGSKGFKIQHINPQSGLIVTIEREILKKQEVNSKPLEHQF